MHKNAPEHAFVDERTGVVGIKFNRGDSLYA